MKSHFFIGIVFILIGLLNDLHAQNIIMQQGFEGTAADTWGFTAPTQGGGTGQVIVGTGNYGAGYAKTGSNSMRAGGGSTACGSGSGNCVNGAGSGGSCTNNPNGKIVQFNTVNIECLSGVQISVSHRCHVFCGGQGAGFDSGESLFFEVSLNGGVWTAIGTLTGFSNYAWTYSTTPAGSSSTVPNPFVYNVPAGTNTVAFRTRCGTDRADEVYYIDDVKITTTTNGYIFPGTPGVWNGNVSVDWNNKCNWENRTIPTLATDVSIPPGANNDCEVLATQTGNCRNININRSRLSVKYFTSTLNVTGNLTIDNNGELDMSLSGNEGGTLNLSGNWLNRRDETYFKEGKSTVNFVGSGNQSITVLGDTKEAFYKSAVNKPGGSVLSNTHLWIDKDIAGGTSTMLTLNNGILDLNTHSLTIWNPNFQAMQRSGGGIMSELTDNSNKITWKMNSNTGSFIFPFIKSDGTYIPFTFNHTAGNAGDVTVSTYGTPPSNLPWPATPTLVTNLISSTGLLPDNRDATVDRFWQIDATGTPTANLIFTYAAGELPASPYNTPAGMRAQRYSSATNQWLFYLPGQASGTYFVTVPSVSSFSTWTLTATASPLPIELLRFNAVGNKDVVDVSWTTVSETDNDFFTVERSKDKVNFEEVGIVDGAGNSFSTLDYKLVDENPFTGISYYRLKQTDFNGSFSYSKTVAVRISGGSPVLSVNYVYYDENNGSILLNINPGDRSSLDVSVTDVAGRLIYKANRNIDDHTHSVSINPGRLTDGLYFLNVTDGEQRVTERIVVY